MTENDVRNGILLQVSKMGVRLWVNTVGTGWFGKVAHRKGTNVTLEHARPVDVGFGPGTSDLIGYTPITVTADMVGKTLAVFTAVEVKSPSGRPSEEQLEFLEHIRGGGGLACVARASDDVFKEISKLSLDFKK
jgi:VRR-NUC domain